MILEFKHGEGTDLVERTLAAVRAHKMEDQVIIMSLELEEVRRVQELAPDIRVGYFASIELGNLTELDVYCIGAKDGMVTADFVKEVQAQGMQVYCWTIDDRLRMVELIEIGVDGIITNDPKAAASVFEQFTTLTPSMRVLLRYRKFWGTFVELGLTKR